MVRAFLLIRVARTGLLDRVRDVSGVIDVYSATRPGTFGVLIAAESMSEVDSIRDRIRSIEGVTIVDLFIQPEELRVDYSDQRGRMRTTIDSLRKLSTSLEQRSRVPAMARVQPGVSREVSRATEEMLQLKFDWLASSLGPPRELERKLRRADDSERKELALGVYSVFRNLSHAYQGSQAVKETLKELDQRFESLLGLDSERFRTEFLNLVAQLRRLVEIRQEYFNAAREGGYEDEFTRYMSQGSTD